MPLGHNGQPPAFCWVYSHCSPSSAALCFFSTLFQWQSILSCNLVNWALILLVGNSPPLFPNSWCCLGEMQQSVFDFWLFVHSITLVKLYSQKQLFKLPGTATLDFFCHLWCSWTIGCILDKDQPFVNLKTESYWLSVSWVVGFFFVNFKNRKLLTCVFWGFFFLHSSLANWISQSLHFWIFQCNTCKYFDVEKFSIKLSCLGKKLSTIFVLLVDNCHVAG